MLREMVRINRALKIVKAVLFVYLIIVFEFQVKSQNLVPNPSFEEFIDYRNSKSNNWHSLQETDTPDYFNFSVDSPCNKVFNEYLGGASPKTGNGFTGIFCYRVHPERKIKNVREFIETPLIGSLEKDSLYRVEVSLRLDDESNLAIKNFGILFSGSSLYTSSDYKLSSLNPQIEFNSSYLDSTNNWITLQSYYAASGSEKYLTLGNFKPDRNTISKNIRPRIENGKKNKWNLSANEKATYYYIDDVIIEKATMIISLSDSFLRTDEGIEDTFNISKIPVDSAIVLRNIVFNFNQYDLLPESIMEINKLLHLMISYPNIRIKLEGHTDNQGSYSYNLLLSIKRVESVAKYLINRGIDPFRIEMAGYSYSYPLVSNATEVGRKINRRVAFTVVKK